MSYRLFSISGRVHTGLFVIALVGTLLMSGCSGDAVQDTVTGTAQSRGLPSIVMSFEPMPREYFSAAQPPARLMRFREKFEALAAAGIDIFFCPRFGSSMRQIRGH